MRHEPKSAWDSVKLLKKGHTENHAQINVMKLRNKKGVSSTIDGENAYIDGDHFNTVFNRDTTVD